jgi:hypothetical protein
LIAPVSGVVREEFYDTRILGVSGVLQVFDFARNVVVDIGFLAN